MPNWCCNALAVAGEPEQVAEFWIVNAQHGLSKSSRNQFLSGPDAHGMAHLKLVGNRPKNDISFRAITQGIGKEVWGTHWDIGGDNRWEQVDKGAWTIPPHGIPMGRLSLIHFDTAWTPPNLWVAAAARTFPDLKLKLGYEEESMGLFGLIHAHGNHFSIDQFDSQSSSSAKALSMALSHGRKEMPLHRKPSALLRSIWADDVAQLHDQLSKSPVASIDEAVKSRWPALFHAAHAGHFRAACLIMERMAKEKSGPPLRLPLGGGKSFGLNDICTNVHLDCAPAVALGRQKVFIQALQHWPELMHEPLAGSMQTFELAVTHQMKPLIQAMISQAPVAFRRPDGSLNGIVGSLARASEDAVDWTECISQRIQAQERAGFLQALVVEILRSSAQENLGEFTPGAIKLFMHLADQGAVDDVQWSVANGDAPCPLDESGHNKKFVNSEFKSLFASEKALRAIEDIMKRAPAPKN